MNRTKSNRLPVAAVAGALALTLAATAFAAAPRTTRPTRPGTPQAAALVAVTVSSADPQAVLATPVRNAATLSQRTFDAQATLNLSIVPIYDRRVVGSDAFDQRVTLTLPSGHVYQQFVTPVVPNAVVALEASRSDLSDLPVRTAALPRLRRLARTVPEGTLTPVQQREAMTAPVQLPVSGTWITKHGLYGEWKVEVEMIRGNRVVASRATTFQFARPQ